jgi:hypothetical protein
MAGNAKARGALGQARARGETPEDVYSATADALEEGLSRYQRAYCLGYLSRLVGRPVSRNPHDAADGEEGVKLAKKWEEGWRDARAGDFEELGRRAKDFRGE